VKEDGDIVTYYRKGLSSLELLAMPAGHHARLSDISTGLQQVTMPSQQRHAPNGV
jgi:hypothetical protein